MIRQGVASWLETTLKLPSVDRARHRVFAITVWLAAALSMFAALQSAFSMLVGLTLLNVLNVAIARTSLHWLDTPHPERSARFLLWGYLITLSLGSLATTPFEPTMLGYLFAIPVVSANMLDARETKHWFGRVILAGSTMIMLAECGVVLPEVDPLPLLTKVFNFAATITATMALLQAMSKESARANQRMLEAERAKSAFFANIGHEIRTPMNGVLGMTDALLQRHLPVEERDMVSTIRSSGGLMLALLDDLLDLSKLEAGRLLLHEHPVSLPGLADELRLLWAPMAAKKGLTLNVWLDAQLPPTVLLDGRACDRSPATCSAMHSNSPRRARSRCTSRQRGTCSPAPSKTPASASRLNSANDSSAASYKPMTPAPAATKEPASASPFHATSPS